MKKPLLFGILLVGLGSAQTAHAQAGLVNLISTGVRLGVMAARQAKADEAPAASAAPIAVAPAAPRVLVKHRTPAEQLPKKGSEQITALEAQLDRCHAALLADSTGVICSPEQRTALQQAAVAAARSAPGWNLQPHHEEAGYYFAEDTRRQQAAKPTK